MGVDGQPMEAISVVVDPEDVSVFTGANVQPMKISVLWPIPKM